MVRRAFRVPALVAVSVVTAFAIWTGPQYFLVLLSHRLGHLTDYRIAVALLQIFLVCLIALLLRAPIARPSTARITYDGLRTTAWFVLAAVMFSLLGGVTILMTSSPDASRLPFTSMLQQWRSEFPVTGLGGRFLAYVLLVPAFEELLFRGLILGFLLRACPPWFALAVSTLLFAATHSNWLHATFAGLVYGLLYLRYQSLLLCVVAHGLNNLIAAASASLLIAYLSEQGLLVPGVSNLLFLQVVWLLVVISCLLVFLHSLFRGTGGAWFRMQPPTHPSSA